MNDNVQTPSFLIAALLAGRLHRVLIIAKRLAINSSNAKGISIRGGDKTVGFKPISDFIGDMAKETISISSKINTTALNFSITAVNEKRAISALDNFTRVIKQLESQSKKDSLEAVVDKINKKLHQYKTEQTAYCKELTASFDDINQRIRAAKIIVTNSRTEASRAGEYQTNLFSIANDIETCSESISDEIKICQNHLTDLTNMIGKK